MAKNTSIAYWLDGEELAGAKEQIQTVCDLLGLDAPCEVAERYYFIVNYKTVNLNAIKRTRLFEASQEELIRLNKPLLEVPDPTDSRRKVSEATPPPQVAVPPPPSAVPPPPVAVVPEDSPRSAATSLNPRVLCKKVNDRIDELYRTKTEKGRSAAQWMQETWNGPLGLKNENKMGELCVTLENLKTKEEDARVRADFRAARLLAHRVEKVEMQMRSAELFPELKDNGGFWAVSFQHLMELRDKVIATPGQDEWNVATVNERYIKHECSKFGKSMAMSRWDVHTGPKRSKVFVTHCWLEPFVEFCNSIEHAFRDREEKPDMFICFMSLMQSDDPKVIAEEVGTQDGGNGMANFDAHPPPFVVALSWADEFLVVRNKRCDIYTRGWCALEAFYAIKFGFFDDKEGKVIVVGPTDGQWGGPTNKNALDAKCSWPQDEKDIIAHLTAQAEHLAALQKEIDWIHKHPAEVPPAASSPALTQPPHGIADLNEALRNLELKPDMSAQPDLDCPVAGLAAVLSSAKLDDVDAKKVADWCTQQKAALLEEVKQNFEELVTACDLLAMPKNRLLKALDKALEDS